MTRHKKHFKLRSMYQWHRYIGVTLALFVILLAVTGIMLNHTGDFKLDKKYIQADWLLDYYGISAPEKISAYAANRHWVSRWNEQLYIDNQLVSHNSPAIIGAVFYEGMVLIAADKAVLAYTTDAQLIEKIKTPAAVTAIAISADNRPVIRTVNGLYISDEQLQAWQTVKQVNAIWSAEKKLPEKLYQQLLMQYRGQGLTLERVILDLHSGRLLGQNTFYLMDFVALLMIFLALSGLWLWVMRKIKAEKHRKAKSHH